MFYFFVSFFMGVCCFVLSWFGFGFECCVDVFILLCRVVCVFFVRMCDEVVVRVIVFECL